MEKQNPDPGLVAACCMTLVNDNSRHFNGTDAIVVFTGDGFLRIREAMRLYHSNLAPFLVIIGPDSLLCRESLNAEEYKNWILQQSAVGNDKNILAVNGQSYTHKQAEQVIRLLKNNDWQKLILVISAFHMPRAYMTVIKHLAMAELLDHITVIPHAVTDNWTIASREMVVEPIDQFTRFWAEEFPRIHKYKETVATWVELANYLKQISI